VCAIRTFLGHGIYVAAGLALKPESTPMPLALLWINNNMALESFK
jgi:hypothetical protein